MRKVASMVAAIATLGWKPDQALAQTETGRDTAPGVTQAAALQPRTARFVINSATVGHPIQVDVTAPPVVVRPGEKLPAIYVLDAGFDMIGQMAGFIMAGGEMAPAYVISIGYPNPRGSYIGDRNNDLSHVVGPFVPGGPDYGGGGAAFEQFLLKELRPGLESRLPLDPSRAILFGHSLGGLFTATVLANNPHAFDGYVIASAPLDRDRTIVEKVRVAAPAGMGRRVYVSYTPQDVEIFEAGALGSALSGPNSTFVVKDRRFDDEAHRSVFLRLPQDAFPFLLPPPPKEPDPPRPQPIELGAAVLARYAGVYRIAQGVAMVVRERGGKLYAQATNEAEFELSAASETEFFYRDPGIPARLRFVAGGDGTVTGLMILQGPQETLATRE